MMTGSVNKFIFQLCMKYGCVIMSYVCQYLCLSGNSSYYSPVHGQGYATNFISPGQPSSLPQYVLSQVNTSDGMPPFSQNQFQPGVRQLQFSYPGQPVGSFNGSGFPSCLPGKLSMSMGFGLDACVSS